VCASLIQRDSERRSLLAAPRRCRPIISRRKVADGIAVERLLMGSQSKGLAGRQVEVEGSSAKY
jgi:hypothetical protein